jgi:hypothetical protein
MRKKVSVQLLAPLYVAGLSFGILLGASIGAEGQLKPLPLESLLKAMPKAPENWKLTKSIAESYYSNWLMSRGIREFEYAPVDPNAPGQGATCKVLLTDTAGNTAELRRFRDFKEEEGEGYQKIRVKSFPAIVREMSNFGTSITLMADERFTVQILLKGLPLNQAGAWIEAINFPALAGVPDESYQGDLVRVTVTVIDELNPDNNITYRKVLSDRDATAASSQFDEDPDAENGDPTPEPVPAE